MGFHDYLTVREKICLDQVLPEHQRQPYGDGGETLSMLGREVRRSRSSLKLYLYHLVDRIQTTVKAQLFSNLTCTLLMMRGGTLLILGQRSRSTWALCV